MRLREVAPVADGDLPLAALKDQLRLGSGFADEGGRMRCCAAGCGRRWRL